MYLQLKREHLPRQDKLASSQAAQPPDACPGHADLLLQAAATLTCKCCASTNPQETQHARRPTTTRDLDILSDTGELQVSFYDLQQTHARELSSRVIIGSSGVTPLCLGIHSIPGEEASERVLFGDSQVRYSSSCHRIAACRSQDHGLWGFGGTLCVPGKLQLP